MNWYANKEKLRQKIVVLCTLLPFLLFGQEQVIESMVFGSPTDAQKSEFTFSGLIQDQTFDLPLIGATILNQNSGSGTVTNAAGTFSIKLPAGKNRLTISFIGYADKEIDIEIYQNAFSNINMENTAVSLEQVTIKDQSKADNIDNVISGVERLDRRKLELKPKLMGETDVLRSIQTFSGVTSTGDGASGFNVRGGNADENLILQDGALILNPSHTLGFFSLFHPDLISSVNLYKGDQPAYFGGRLSSVLEVNLKEGNKEKLQSNIGLGMISSRVTLEGPIQKGKSSFLIGGRGSYIDWMLNRVKDIDVRNSSAVFYDLTAKLNGRIGPKTKVGLTAFMAGDEFKFSDIVNFEYQTRTGIAFINHLLTDNWNVKLSLNIGDYTSSLFDIEGNDISKLDNTVRYVRPQLRSFYQISESQKVTAGAEMNYFKVNPGSLTPDSPESNVVPEFLPEEKGVAISPYIQYEWNVNEAFTLAAGLRYTNYKRTGPGSVDTYREDGPRGVETFIETLNFEEGETIKSYSAILPRFSFKYSLNESSSIKGGFNQSFQYLNQISNTASATPVDLWKLSDFHVEPQKSSNASIGYFRNFKDNAVITSLQVFYRNQDRIIEYKDFADLLLNENVERELVDGTGRSYGAEINFSKTGERNSWQINYTYSRSERRILETSSQRALNNGEWYPSNYDKPHALFMTFSRKVAQKASLALNFTYSTGRPTTAPISNFKIDNLLNIPVFSERNQFRIPDYHRLDVSYTIGPLVGKKKKSSSEIIFSIYNVYSRKNAYSVFFEQRPSRSVSANRIATLGSFFPAATVNFSF